MLFAFLMMWLHGMQLLPSSLAASGWTYSTTAATCAGTTADPCGIPYWSKVSPACGYSSQSPIDISNVVVMNNVSLPTYNAINGGCDTWLQFSTNYTFEAAFAHSDFSCTNLQLTYNNELYILQQMHFHSPSEHTFGGGLYSAEVHLVHKNTVTGGILVVGVPMQESAASLTPYNNTFLQTMWNAGGANLFTGELTEVEDSPSLLNPYNSFFPGRTGAYHYNGSFTTPPCSQNVKWFVLDEAIPISSDDLRILRRAITAWPTALVSETGNNNRYPVSALNSRTVYYTTGAMTSNSIINNYGNNDDDDDEVIDAVEGVSITAFILSVFAIVAGILNFIWLQQMNQKLDKVMNAGTRGEVSMHSIPSPLTTQN